MYANGKKALWNGRPLNLAARWKVWGARLSNFRGVISEAGDGQNCINRNVHTILLPAGLGYRYQFKALVANGLWVLSCTLERF